MNETIIVAILGSGVLSAIVSGVFNLINTRSKKKTAEEIERDKKLEGLEKGIQLLLLGEIERQADKHTAAGKISRKELKWFLELHEAYKALNGDGYADDMKKDVARLPVGVEK